MSHRTHSREAGVVADLPEFVDVLRADDLAVMRLRFDNLRLEGRQIVNGTAPRNGLLIIDLPPQAILEQILPDEVFPVAGATRAAFSRPSRLVFNIATPVEANLAALLEACRGPSEAGLDQTLSINPDIAFQDQFERLSAVELPWGVVLQEQVTGRWRHAGLPQGSKMTPRIELWHTRLAEGERGKPFKELLPVPVRVVWGDQNAPFVDTSLNNEDRKLLAQRGLDRDQAAVRADRLILSALGGWLDAVGDWSGAATGVKFWRHRMTLGRDHYVNIAVLGNLLPFGHRAVFIRISERRLQKPPGVGDVSAVLRKRGYIVVLQPTLTFAPPRHDFPFTTVSVKPVVTPFLRPENESAVVPGSNTFWPRVGASATTATDFLFHVEAMTVDGRTVEFSTPLLFTSFDKPADQTKAVAAYMTTGDATARRRRLPALGGQRVPFVHASPATTRCEVERIEFGVALETGEANPYRPSVITAFARVPAVRELTGADHVVAFQPKAGLPLGIFATLIEDTLDGRPVPKPAVRFDPETAGGLATPNFGLASLSTSHGALGKTGGQGTAPAFDPNEFFEGAPQLLGAIDLKEILGTVTTVSEAATKVPRTVTTEQPDGSRVTTLSWQTDNIKPSSVGHFMPDGARFSIEVARSATAGAPPSVTSRGELTNFSLLFPHGTPLVKVRFPRVMFTTATGRKPELDVAIDQPTFDGPLAFVQTLADILPATGFNDPPALEVTPEGVRIGYSLGIPTVPIGPVMLQNLALTSAFELPLLGGKTRLLVSFSDRENRFLVTYAALGGGGYFTIVLSLDGVDLLEAAVEFGGGFAINLGVASGAVTLTAGIFYGLVEGEHSLSGFVRCYGCLEVLGLISVSVEFLLALTYRGADNSVTGTATVKVSVKVLLLKKTVSLTVERTIAGPPKKGAALGPQLAFAPVTAKGLVAGAGDFSFAATLPLAQWQMYCQAYAPE